jgi:uncharacterized membrane protein YGL010W
MLSLHDRVKPTLVRLERIGDRVVGIIVFFVFIPLLILSALTIFFFDPPHEPQLLRFTQVILCGFLVLLGVILHLFKERFPGWYGVFEIAVGTVINWINIAEVANDKASIQKRLVVFTAGVYLTKKGIDAIAEPVKQHVRRVREDRGFA